MNKQDEIKLVELKLERNKIILYYLLTPLIAVISLIIGLTLRGDLEWTVSVFSIGYISIIYIIFLDRFSPSTNKLIKNLEDKK